MTEIAHEPDNTPIKEVDPTTADRLSKLKTAFLYLLIGGLVTSTLISVIALLIGQFNSSILKSLLTIFIFFSHSLFILAILWADRYNQVGRLLLPTSIVVITFANMVTTTLGTWELISTEFAWRALGMYVLVLGAIFMITGILKLRIAHQTTQIGLFTSIGLIAATVLALIPWVLQVVTNFDPLYYRVVAALSILATASFLIALILRGIAIGHKPQLTGTAPRKNPTTGGLLAMYITAGSITALVWFGGFIGFVVSGVDTSTPHREPEYNSYY